MWTLVQEYLISHSASSLSSLEGRKAYLLIFCMAIGIGNTYASMDPGFVDIKTTAAAAKDFKHRVPPVKTFADLARTGYPVESSQFRKR